MQEPVAEADVIVVGAGAAGRVVARRLVDAKRSVLLAEAGPDLRQADAPELHDGWRLPAGFDWGYESEPGASGQREPLRRVRGVGGTSWMTRFAVRGSPADFDAWAAAGNEGWVFDDVLPYFRRLESDRDYGDRAWHGSDGPIPVTRYASDERTDIHSTAIEATRRHGLPAVADHNEPWAIGIGPMPMNSRGGSRVTTADAYLPSDGTNQRLQIASETTIASVVLDAGRAVGVRRSDGSVIHGSTVIVTAGTYGSPAILLRSGIGPADDLSELGIPVAVDLPGVGANLADHPAVDIDSGWQGAGRDTPIFHSIGTFRSTTSTDRDPPDLMLWMVDPRGDPPNFEIDVVLLKPRSRGRVRLRTADPAAAPRIELPGVSDRRDVERLMEGYRRGWEIVNDPLVRRLRRTVHADAANRRCAGGVHQRECVFGATRRRDVCHGHRALRRSGRKCRWRGTRGRGTVRRRRIDPAGSAVRLSACHHDHGCRSDRGAHRIVAFAAGLTGFEEAT